MTQSNFQFSFRAFLIAAIFTLFGCKSTVSQVSLANTLQVAQEKEESISIPTDTLSSFFIGLRQKASVAKFYKNYGSAPIWIENDRNAVRTDSMLLILRKSAYYGLPAINYHRHELEKLERNRDNAIRTELLLTDAFLSLASDLKFGLRNLKQKESEDSFRLALLSRVVANGNLLKTLESQEPVFTGYKLLKEGLRGLLDSVDIFYADSVSLLEKMRLVSINLERWRRESVFSTRYIFINIPSFMLEVVENDSIVLSSRVIVGTPEKETPVLSSMLECFTIYPYWHVPRTIAVRNICQS